MKSSSTPFDPSAVLTRESLANGTLRDQLAHAAGPGLLWTDKQIDLSFEETMAGVTGDDIWVFGYGSLIWNPIFPLAGMRWAKIFGFHRALCLSSVVGRGSRDLPGIMLALDAGGSCTGVALKVGGEDLHTELRLLWRREMLAGSYTPKWVNAHSGNDSVRALTFVANRNRPNYIGRLSDEEAVCRVSTASGPFGSNLDYLQRTQAGLEAYGIRDPHIDRLLQICDLATDKNLDHEAARAT